MQLIDEYGELTTVDNPMYAKFYTEEQIQALKENTQKIKEIKLQKMKEDEEKYDTISIKTYFRGNVEEIKLILEELEPYERIFLFSIAPYVGFTDCCIKSGNNVALNFEGMMKISKISKGKLSEVLQNLRKKDIIYKGNNSKDIQYFVNPWIFNKGNKYNKVLRTMFENYKIRTKGNVKWKDLKE